MEAVKEKTKKETILMALSMIPIATTRQLSTIYSNNASPLKKVSQPLQELMKEKLIEFTWHKREKVWRLTKRGLLTMNGSRQKCEHIDHALEVAEIYFRLKPFQWLYEYEQDFFFDDKIKTWNPDAVFAYLTKENKKTLIAVEVQRSPLSETGWKNKFKIWNMYFQEAYKTAEFQQWKSKGDPIIPHIVVISNQKNVCGLNIPGRELRVIQNITEL